MANETIGVNLKFSADVSAAKRAMAELQGSLAQIHKATNTSANPGIRYAQDLHEASQAAAQLRIQLANAFNQDTGKLNLTRFNMEMKQSGMTVEKYRAALSSIGPQGKQAFTQLAHAISTADAQTFNLNNGLQRLGATFMNTLRYQMSASIIMAFTKSISEAVGYVKDLNSSLNDIRIVTGYGADKMKIFAEQANKAAKALSTTTNEYAKASLIYFQQGLNDADVQKRTDLTIKMANVTGQAVSEVSDQLTAVWNNFDDGTKSLEHYVDVMVALGAATASSSEEISEGLNKFAAVAETVGLSYEYAAAALATVTAETRQSADVVGTAFKTLFARIQDLDLGKTLDDGTTLGQYSEALKSVGINIKDSSGGLKDMNIILDEMGLKWKTLSQDQQVALAKSVAGVRQYTQLIALMDNWDVFQKNLTTANTSAGALSEQADIYAESWEAASKEVTAALETIYNKLLDDKFFIGATNTLADFIDLIGNLIDSLGGMPGLLALIGGALTRVFSTQLSAGLNNALYSMHSLTKAGRAENARVQNEFAEAAARGYGTAGASGQQGQIAKEEARLQEIYIRNKDKMTELERSMLELRMSELKTQKQSLNAEIEKNKVLEDEAKLQKDISQRLMSDEALGRQKGFTTDVVKEAKEKNKYLKNGKIISGKEDTSFVSLNEEQQNKVYKDLKYSASSQKINTALNIGNEDTFAALREGSTASVEKQAKAIEELQSRLKALGVTKEAVDAQMQDEVGTELAQKYQNLASAVDASEQAIKEYNQAVATGAPNQAELKQKVEATGNAVRAAEQELHQSASAMKENAQQAAYMAGGTQASVQAQIDLGEASGNTKLQVMELGQQYQKTGQNAEVSMRKISDFGGIVTNLAQGLSGISMAFTSLAGIFDVLNNEDMTFWEKLLSITTALGMAIPMLITGWKSLTAIEWKNTAGKALNALATWGQVQAENQLARAKEKTSGKTVKQTIVDGVNTAGKKIKQTPGKIKDRWNETALQNSNRFELQKTGKNKGQYKILSGDRAGSFTDGKTAKSMAGTDAFKGAAKSFGYAALAAAIVVASIAAAKGIYEAADEAYNRDRYAAERAEKAAQSLADAYGEASEKYEKLNTASKSYFDQVNKLDEMQKGTLEYQEAISKTNEEALSLIDTYDELAGQYHTTAEGLIVFNEGALENIKVLELQRKNAAAAAATIAKQDARDARSKADATEFLREDIKSNEMTDLTTEDTAIIGKGTAIGLGAGAVGGVLAGIGSGMVVSGMSLGAAVGSAGTPIGAAIGAAAGLVVGAITGVVTAIHDQKEATEREEKAFDTLSKAYEKMGNAALSPDMMKDLLASEGITDPNLIASLEKNTEGLEELFAEMKANTEARKVENANLAREQMASQDLAFSSFDESVQSAMSNIEGIARTKAKDEIDYNKGDYSKGGLFGRSFSTTATKKGKEQFKAWKEASDRKGIDDVDFKKDTIKYTYLDEEGKRQKAELTYEELAAWQEGQEIAKQTKENYSEIRDIVFDIAGKNGGEGILNVLGGQDINNLTKEQFEDLKAAYRKGEFNDELEKIGKINGENYIDAVKTAIDSWDEDTAFTNFAQRTKAEIDTILKGGSASTGVSEKALESYSESLMKNSKALNGNGKALNDWQKTANKKIAAEMAVANAKFAVGVRQLNEAVTESIDVLAEWDEGCLATWEAVGKVQKALEKTFGVKVSANYVKENFAEIQKLAEGDTSALEELQIAAAKDFIINLAIDDNSKNNLLAGLNGFIEAAEAEAGGIQIDVGATMDLKSYTGQLNEMLEAGKITADEVKSTFAAIGYAVDIRTTQKEVKNVSTFAMKGPNGEEWSGEIVNTSVMDVPYIAGEDTQQAGTDVKTSTGDTVTVGARSNGDGFTYTGGNKTKGAAVSDINKEYAKEAANKRKELEDDVDIFHEEKAVLSDIERELNKINKIKDQAYGGKRLKVMDQELAKLEEQSDALQDLAEKQKQELNVRAAELNTNYGAQFNDDGQITNYEEIRQQINDIYTTEWEKAGSNEERKKELDKWREKAIKDLEDYENLLGEYKDSAEKAVDVINETLSKRLAKIDYEIEINIAVNDYELKLLERALEKLDDPIYDGAKSLENINSQFTILTKNIDTYAEGMEDVFETILGEDVVKNLDFSTAEGIQDAFKLIEDKDLTPEQTEKLKTWSESMIDSLDNMEELYTTSFDKIGEAFDKIGEEADFAAKRVDHFSSVLTTYQDIVDIVGQKQLGITDDIMLELSGAQVDAAQAGLQIAKTNYDTQKSVLDNYRKELAKAEASGDEESIEEWKELIKNAETSVMEAENALNSAWKNTLTAAAKDFENAVNIALKELEKGLSGLHDNLDELQEVYDQQSEISERYLADYEKVYEFSKLTRDINKSITDTNNIKGKQELLKLQQKINELNESGADVSQYELDTLRKKYELRIAEIAMEESQQNKSIVRMRRDSEGNMAYVYTADQNDIAEKQQSYEDKMYELMDFNQNYIKEQESAIIQSRKEMSSKIKEVMLDSSLSEEERLAAIGQIKQHYYEKEMFHIKEMQNGLNGNAEIYANDYANYSGYTVNKINLEKQFKDTFDETTLSQITGYNTVEELRTSFDSAYSEMVPRLEKAFENFETDISSAFKTLGENLETFPGKLQTEIPKMVTEINKVPAAFKNWAGETGTAINNMVSKLGEKLPSFRNELGKYTKEVEAWVNGVKDKLKLSLTMPDGSVITTDGDKVIKTDTSGNQTVLGPEDGITQQPPSGGGTKKYYGTYTIGGTTYTTKSAYTSKTDAIRAAESQAKNTALSLAKVHAYNKSIGYNDLSSTQYAGKTSGWKISYGTSEYGTNAYKESALKDTYAFEFKQGGKIYFSDDTKIEDKGADGTGERLVLINGTGYHFTQDELKIISKNLSSGSNFNKIFMSGSGDTIFEDPGFEVGDRLKTNGYVKSWVWHPKHGLTGAFQNWSISDLQLTKDKMFYDEKSKSWFFKTSATDYSLNSYYGLNGDLALQKYPVWINEKYFESYDTGGYTGSWDSSGRLAMLHQKEIVLNAADTENFLAAINIVRDIAKAIDLQAVAYQSTLGSLVASANVSMHPQTVQQDVVIHAEFPNATNRSEIEAAFDNLINRASQFANRKN